MSQHVDVPCYLCYRSGGLTKSFWTISRLLATFGQNVTAYDLIKYNLSVDPRRPQPGSLLVVPKIRSEPLQGNVIAILGTCFALTQHDMQDKKETERKNQQECLVMSAHTLTKVQARQIK